MIARRQLLKAAAAGGAAAVIPWGGAYPGTRTRAALGRASLARLDARTIPKYVTRLTIPPAMPQAPGAATDIDRYVIGVRQFRQQILPVGHPTTPVWGYGAMAYPATFHYPSFTIEATVDRPTQVTWVNDLVDSTGRFRPHLLTVDPTLHWANPPGGLSGRDSHPMFDGTPPPYTGPVPLVPHLHGGHTGEESDGYPEAWFLPDAVNIPAGYARVGSFYDQFRDKAVSATGVNWPTGGAVFRYRNDQRATTLWYHDHTLGMTRVNVYAGPAGFYLLRGGDADLPAGTLPGPAPAAGDPRGVAYHEIPLAIQDRSFNRDGTLFYPPNRTFFDGFEGPYDPDSDLPPYWNPEVFGNTMVVNGATWPVLVVEPRRYRLRLLNGCNARFLMLKLVTQALGRRPTVATLPFWQIGTEGGFLPAPVKLERLLMGSAERADVVVDFTGLRPGTALYLINEGPDEPFGGGEPGVDFAPANPYTTGQVMKFVVGALRGPDTSVPPDQLTLPSLTPVGAAGTTRALSLNELDSEVLEDVGPTMGTLGLVTNGEAVPLGWGDAITENPSLGATEIWELHNFTVDAHPIHVHQVQFQVVDRGPAGGARRGPESWETGYKDTVIAYPGETTRVAATFDLAGRYVWHCHIVEHEDNEMMRPFQVG